MNAKLLRKIGLALFTGDALQKKITTERTKGEIESKDRNIIEDERCAVANCTSIRYSGQKHQQPQQRRGAAQRG